MQETLLTRLSAPLRTLKNHLSRKPREPGFGLSDGDYFRFILPETGSLSSFRYCVTRLRVIDNQLIVDGIARCGPGVVRASRPVKDIRLDPGETAKDTQP
jgi:hypothetical protein